MHNGYRTVRNRNVQKKLSTNLYPVWKLIPWQRFDMKRLAKLKPNATIVA